MELDEVEVELAHRAMGGWSSDGEPASRWHDAEMGEEQRLTDADDAGTNFSANASRQCFSSFCLYLD